MKINDISLLGYSAPTISTGKKMYVEFYWLNSHNQKERFRHYIRKADKSFMRAQATDICTELFLKLREGWRPEKGMTIDMNQKCKTLNDVIAEYEIYLDKMVAQKTMKNKTYIDYKSRLKILKKYIAFTFTGKIEDFNQGFISRFLDWLMMKNGVSTCTRNNYRTWLSSFCTWLQERGYIPENYIKHINNLKEAEKERDALPVQDIARLGEYLEKTNRHYLLACLFEYYTFIRPGELSELKIKDLFLKEQKVFISGKISKNRHDGTVALNKKIINLMIDLGIFKCPDNYYLFGKDFKPSRLKADSRQFHEYFRKVRKALHFPISYKFYSLKDSGIRDVANSKGIVIARDQARHSDISTTNCYLKGPGMVHEELKDFEGAL